MISEHLKGYSCFVPCDRNFIDGKKPIDRIGDFNDNLVSYNNACEYLKKGCNIGFVAGHGTIIIDCDNEILVTLVKKLLPETYEERTTSGGVHFIFKYEGVGVNRDINSNLLHLGEIRANRQYIIIAPSVCKSKIDGKFNSYKIIKDIPLATITDEDINVLLNELKNEKIVCESIKTTGGVCRDKKENGVDRSKYDYAKVCELLEKGYDNFTDIESQMKVLGSSKWKERGLSYQLSTYRGACMRVGVKK